MEVGGDEGTCRTGAETDRLETETRRGKVEEVSRVTEMWVLKHAMRFQW
jgi:hypothetical protein